jgi:hypothetical protein
MHSTFITRRARLVLLGAATLVLLLLWMADPVFAAPRSGITAARGVPAEAVARPDTGGEAYTAASIRAPAGQSADYFVVTPFAALLVGAAGALLLLGAAHRYGVAQRRGRGGRLAELTGRRPPSARDRRDRRAA